MGLRKAGGNWVAGDDFFDREAEIEALTERVEDGIHTLVTAQRRMGKTSLVRELLRHLQEQGNYETVFVDLEDASTAADAVAEIAAASRGTRGVWARVRDWGSRSSSATLDRIDELPILVNRLLQGHDYEITPERRRDTDEFLSWLRKNGQAHRGHVRIIVSGSVGLEPILERAGLSAHANIFSPLDLQPWDEETAVSCLGELAESYGIQVPHDVRQGMFHRLRCGVPHHVQLYFDKLHEYLRRERRSEATADDVALVYEQEMLGVRGQIHLEHYQTRLRTTLGSEGYEVALELLTEAAVSEGQLTDEAIRRYEGYRSIPSDESGAPIRDVLHVLEHDGYLTRRGPGYQFVSGLVEDWWRTRNGRRFIPFHERRA